MVKESTVSVVPNVLCQSLHLCCKEEGPQVGTAAGKFSRFLGVKIFSSPRGSIRLGQLIPFSSMLTFSMPLYLQPEFELTCFTHRGLHYLLNAETSSLHVQTSNLLTVVNVFEKD